MIIDNVSAWSPDVWSSTRSACEDYPVVQAAVIVLAVILLTVNLLVDLLYTVVDPRVNLDEAASSWPLRRDRHPTR